MALMSQPGVGPAAAAARAGADDLDGLDEQALAEQLDRARDQVQAAQQRGIDAVSCFDERFPARLKAIPSAPAVLWVRGDLTALDAPLVAVVGTRQPTVFGATATRTVTDAVCEAGGGVCSGLALGVDGLAHRAALAHRAPNVIVLAGGIADEDIHPGRHRQLALDILDAGGLILSENPPGTETTAHRLVARNRMQSGLSVCTAVIQTGLSGGTPHTARFAMAQGRPLFCPRPHARDERSAGNWALLEEPATRLPQLMAAFKDHAGLCRRFGERPAAQALTRENVTAWANVTVRPPAQPASDEPPTLF